MADLVFLALLAGFFGLCVLFIGALDRMIDRGDPGGPPSSATVEVDADDAPALLAARR